MSSSATDQVRKDRERQQTMATMPDGADLLANWLAPMDQLALECDGLTRVISALLVRESIAHTVLAGSVAIENVGTIPMHWWIELADGTVCDFRCRMWLGDDDRVPHGVFKPRDGQHYQARTQITDVASPALFSILADRQIDDFPPLANQNSNPAGMEIAQ